MSAPDTDPILYKVTQCLHQTQFPRGTCEPVPGSEMVLFVANMKILGGGVGGRQKINYLL